MALMEADMFSPAVKKGIEFIKSSKTAYGFGSTQSTVMALKALLKFSQNNKIFDNGVATIYINGQKVHQQRYGKAKINQC